MFSYDLCIRTASNLARRRIPQTSRDLGPRPHLLELVHCTRYAPRRAPVNMARVVGLNELENVAPQADKLLAHLAVYGRVVLPPRPYQELLEIRDLVGLLGDLLP